MPVRVPIVVVAVVLGLTCGIVALATLSGVPAARPNLARAAAERVHPPHEQYAVEVLHDWDARRAAAWATGDEAALSRLYTATSTAAIADVAMLRRYSARGLVVRGLRMQVLRARVLVARPRRLELEVTDRLAAATAARAGDEGVRRRLPTDGPATRLLVLRREHGTWLMQTVSARGRSGGR
jgi:hypothetical protein